MGRVADARGQGVMMANVYLKDTYDGTSTGESGEFQFLTTEKGTHTLVVNLVGYKRFEQQVSLNGGDLSVNIRLQEEINELQAWLKKNGG